MVMAPSAIVAVATPPFPPPPLKVTVGASVYPAPGFVMYTVEIPPPELTVAKARASTPPLGAVEIDTVGAEL